MRKDLLPYFHLLLPRYNKIILPLAKYQLVLAIEKQDIIQQFNNILTSPIPRHDEKNMASGSNTSLYQLHK